MKDTRTSILHPLEVEINLRKIFKIMISNSLYPKENIMAGRPRSI